MNDNLQHHGIKGQKWGVRRFQNNDGGLTPLGKLRYGTSKDYEEIDQKLKKTDSYIKKATQYQKDKEHKEYEKKIKTDLSKMSDDELRQIVNRMNMEERYTQVMKSREKDEGESATMKWLRIAGTVTTVGSSALTIAIQMKKLMETTSN